MDARDEADYLKEGQQQSERMGLERIEGSSIVPSELKKEVQNISAKKNLYQQGIESGLTPEQAQQKVAESGIGSETPRLDRMAAEQRQLESSRGIQPDLGGFKTYGDKSSFEAKNAIRKLQGLEPLQAPLAPLAPKNQFLVDLEKSASFGAESALTGQKGQTRAFEAGIRAGYSPEETRKLIADTAARITDIADQQTSSTTTQIKNILKPKELTTIPPVKVKEQLPPLSPALRPVNENLGGSLQPAKLTNLEVGVEEPMFGPNFFKKVKGVTQTPSYLKGVRPMMPVVLP